MLANPKLGENDPSSTPIVASVAREMILPKAFNLVKGSASTSGSNDRQDSFKRVARSRSLPFREAQAQLLNSIFCEEGLFAGFSSLRARTRHFHGIPLVEFFI